MYRANKKCECLALLSRKEKKVEYIELYTEFSFFRGVTSGDKLSEEEKGRMFKKLHLTPDSLGTVTPTITLATTSAPTPIILKYWYRDDFFACYLLSDATVQVSVVFCKE